MVERAAFVRINEDRIPTYAAALPLDQARTPRPDLAYHYFGPEEETVAYVLTLDAVNFGSAYFPHLQQPPGISGHFDGYFAISGALKRRFETEGPFSTPELQALTPQDCADLFGQTLADERVRELMIRFAAALNELGAYLAAHFAGQANQLVRAAGRSVERLVALLAKMRHFQDVADYHGLAVPFYKRAQITAADLYQTFAGQGPGAFDDLQQLTIFADNAVPHVLRTDGILRYQPDLAARIDAGQPLPPGSLAEIEIRAAAVHAVELMMAALRPAHPQLTTMQIDYLLWHGSHAPRYQEHPPHRTYTFFY